MKRLIGRVLLGASMLALAAVPAGAQNIDRIVAFGDSYADQDNALQLGLIPAPLLPLYPTGRFTGGTNYVDTLSELLDAPVVNFAIGGARANPDFLFEVSSFAAGGGGVAFPTVTPSFEEGDLLTVSIGGNDARAFGSTPGATVAGAPAAAAPAIAATTLGLDTLVAAGAPTISFLAGDTGQLPEVAANPTAAALRTAFSTAFNTGVQDVLAGYAADGVMVHYLDLTLLLEQVQADPGAYGLTAITCPAFPDPTCLINAGQGFLFYGDLLHPTSQGSAIIAHYIATQLAAPLNLQQPSDLALDTARQFGRTLSSRLDTSGGPAGELAQGMRLFAVGDFYQRDVPSDRATERFDIDTVAGTIGATYGFGNGVAGVALNYSKGKARSGRPNVANDHAKSWQVGVFGGAGFGAGYVQGYAGYGRDRHDIDRAGVVTDMDASPKGNHWLAGAKAGYLIPIFGVTAGPVAAIDYAKAKVRGYTEEGDPALTLDVSPVNVKALAGSLGGEFRARLDLSGLQVQSFGSAMLEKDLAGDSRSIRFAQTSAPGIVNTWALEDRSKKAYVRMTGGSSVQIIGSLRIDASVSRTMSRDDGNDMSVHVGLNGAF